MSLRIIAGKFKGRILKSPKTTKTRPTQGMLREAVFNICQNEVPGARFLDLFAGSGAMSFEALSRGAVSATLVEQAPAAIRCIRENSALLTVDIRLLPMPVERAAKILGKEGAQFDLIYIDPPYDQAVHLELAASLAAPGALIFVEERREPKKVLKKVETSLRLQGVKEFGIAALSIYSA